MICSNCGKQLPDDTKFCPECGTPIGGQTAPQKKYCKFCGAQIDIECVICPVCGKQVEELRTQPAPVYQAPPITITNVNQNVNQNVNAAAVYGRAKNKWVAFFLCLFFGIFGAHKFYEGRVGMGLLYIFTMGLFGIGWIIDIIALLFKPNPYFVP